MVWNGANRSLITPRRARALLSTWPYLSAARHTLAPSAKCYSRDGGMRSAFGINGKREKYVELHLSKPEGKTQLGRSRLSWVSNSTLELQRVGREGVHWINLAKVGEKGLTVVDTVMNIRGR